MGRGTAGQGPGGDSELLWGPGVSPTPRWAPVSPWLALATEGPAGLGQGTDVQAKAQSEERQEGREERERGGEGDTESRRQKGREKNRPQTENPEGQLCRQKQGWVGAGGEADTGRAV